MKQGKKRIVPGALALLSVALMLMQIGCVGEAVRALDYSLESKLYSVQQDVVPQDGSATPEMPGETQIASETATPTPTPLPTSTPVSSADITRAKRLSTNANAAKHN